MDASLCESTRYHSFRAGVLTLSRKPVKGHCQVGSLMGRSPLKGRRPKVPEWLEIIRRV